MESQTAPNQMVTAFILKGQHLNKVECLLNNSWKEKNIKSDERLDSGKQNNHK